MLVLGCARISYGQANHGPKLDTHDLGIGDLEEVNDKGL